MKWWKQTEQTENVRNILKRCETPYEIYKTYKNGNVCVVIGSNGTKNYIGLTTEEARYYYVKGI